MNRNFATSLRSEEICRAFALTLKEKRREAGETQRDLADALGIERKTIVAWENGRTAPRLDDIVRLAEHFEIDKIVIQIKANSTNI